MRSHMERGNEETLVGRIANPSYGCGILGVGPNTFRGLSGFGRSRLTHPSGARHDYEPGVWNETGYRCNQRSRRVFRQDDPELP
jgi:hypothetical protein